MIRNPYDATVSVPPHGRGIFTRVGCMISPKKDRDGPEDQGTESE